MAATSSRTLVCLLWHQSLPWVTCKYFLASSHNQRWYQANMKSLMTVRAFFSTSKGGALHTARSQRSTGTSASSDLTAFARSRSCLSLANKSRSGRPGVSVGLVNKTRSGRLGVSCSCLSLATNSRAAWRGVMDSWAGSDGLGVVKSWAVNWPVSASQHVSSEELVIPTHSIGGRLLHPLVRRQPSQLGH